TLTMEANHQIPIGTSIDYEVALYDPNKSFHELIWHPISSLDEKNPKASQAVEFNTKKLQTAHIRKGEPTGEIINGMKVFRLIKDNGDPIISEILNEDLSDTETFDTIKNAQLLRGINQWKREKTYAPFKGEIPLNSKWNEIYRHHPENVHIDYLPIGNILSLT